MISLIGLATMVLPQFVAMPRPRFTVGVGLVSTLGGLYAYWKMMVVVSLNLASRELTQARPFAVRSGPATPFTAIHALQLMICRIQTTEGGTFVAGELNAVLNDGTRIELVSHSELDVLRADCETLRSLLRVPVWEHKFPDVALKRAASAPEPWRVGSLLLIAIGVLATPVGIAATAWAGYMIVTEPVPEGAVLLLLTFLLVPLAVVAIGVASLIWARRIRRRHSPTPAKD